MWGISIWHNLHILEVLHVWKIPSRLCCSLISPESKLCYGTNKQSYSNLCNERTLRKINSPFTKSACHKDSWQSACRADGGTESLIYFSLLTDQFLLYFFTSYFSWLLSKNRSDTTPAVPAPPLKHTHWVFLTNTEWITAVIRSMWEFVYVQFIQCLYKKTQTQHRFEVFIQRNAHCFTVLSMLLNDYLWSLITYHISFWTESLWF